MSILQNTPSNGFRVGAHTMILIGTISNHLVVAVSGKVSSWKWVLLGRHHNKRPDCRGVFLGKETMKPSQAHQAVSAFVKRGALTPLDTCQTCGTAGRTVAHHWRGYAYPLDVWWVCLRCNRKLWRTHDGAFSLQMARNYVAMPIAPLPGSEGWRRMKRKR